MKNAVRSLACACACLFTLASFAALPSGYTELKSVGFTGQQYVDLGYTPTNENFGFTLDLVYTGKVSKTAGEYCPVLGSSLKNQGYFGGITVSGYASTGGGQMTFCRDSVHHVMYDPRLVPGKRCFYELRKRGWSMRQYGGGTNSTTTLSTPFSQDVFYGSLYLGAIHNDASEPSANGCLRGIVHRMTLYDGLTVVADFVPARDGEGRVGLYDVVGDLGFRQSASATPLVAGAELVLPEGYEELTYAISPAASTSIRSIRRRRRTSAFRSISSTTIGFRPFPANTPRFWARRTRTTGPGVASRWAAFRPIPADR